MIEFSEAKISHLVLHHISSEAHLNQLGDEVYDYEAGDERETLKRIFLKPFLNAGATYEFVHNIDLDLNPLFKLSKAIYNDADFLEQSVHIHEHLKTQSRHPNIKDGDLFVVRYKDIQLNAGIYEGLGIYKIENKDHFLETTGNNGQPGLHFKKGIGSRKLDKACLILFTEEPYTIFVIDNASTETEYWQSDFINLDFKKDHINSTSQFMTLAKTFVTDQIPHEYEVTRAEQIDLLNRSVAYFKNHDTFDKDDFETTVFRDEKLIQSFRNFDEAYRENFDMDLADNFQISAQAVKKQARVFKSVLKLDKNFHIYIHGNRDMIEQGIDADGRKYYKIYYEEEQ